MIRTSTLAKTLSTLIITAGISNTALAYTDTSHHRLHPINPLLESNRLAIIHNEGMAIGDIDIIDTIHWQNAKGNVHINSRPTMLSALRSVTIPDAVAYTMKPVPQIIERPPEFFLIERGATSRTVENELVTVIQDHVSLQAQVASTTGDRSECEKTNTCEASEIVLQ